MSITVLDAMKLNSLKNFRLVAGQWGLNRSIERVGILDYEYVKNIKGQFVQGEFILSSFLFAKDDVSLLDMAIRSLIEDNVACLAIKNIYYDELPAEVIGYADKKGFPIFIFDNSVFFEDIITEITDIVRSVDKYAQMEAKVDMILHKNSSKTLIRELAMEINGSFNEKFIVLYLKEKRYTSNKNIINILEKYKQDSHSKGDAALKYRDGILGIITSKKTDMIDWNKAVYDFISSMNINSDKFYIGIGENHFAINDLNIGIAESLNAMRICEINSQDMIFYENIGIYKILLPYMNEHWINDFCLNLILPLKYYDEKNGTEIFHTAFSYIENDGNIKETARALFLHENTIRYRINKVKEILNMQNLDGSFYEQLSVAIKIYKFMN
jgi:hypothetical protein